MNREIWFHRDGNARIGTFDSMIDFDEIDPREIILDAQPDPDELINTLPVREHVKSTKLSTKRWGRN